MVSPQEEFAIYLQICFMQGFPLFVIVSRTFYKAKALPFGGAVEHVCEPERVYPFRGTKPTRSLTTSPPMMRPATDGTKALEPGTERRMVHLRWVPGGQMQ